MSEENKEVKTEEVKAEEVKTDTTAASTPLTAVPVAAAGAVKPKSLTEAQLQDLVNKVKDDDMKVIAQLLVEIKHENDKANKHAKRSSIFAVCTSFLCLVLVVVLLFVVLKFIPIITNVANEANELIINTNKIVVEANDVIGDVIDMVDQTGAMLDDTADMIDDTAIVVKNLEGITTDLSKTDFEGMMNGINELVVTSQESIEDAVDRIDEIDLDTLNKSIKDLNSIINPLAKLFGKKK